MHNSISLENISFPKNEYFVRKNKINIPKWSANKYNREFKMHDYYGLKNLKREHYKYFPDEATISFIKRVID